MTYDIHDDEDSKYYTCPLVLIVVIACLFVHLFHCACCQFTPPPPPCETTTSAHNNNNNNTPATWPVHVLLLYPCLVMLQIQKTLPDLLPHTKSTNSACPVMPTWLTRMCHTPHQPHQTTTWWWNLIFRHVTNDTSSDTLPLPLYTYHFQISGFHNRPSPTRQHNTTINHFISFHSRSVPNQTLPYILSNIMSCYYCCTSSFSLTSNPNQIKSNHSHIYLLTYLLTN